MRRILAAVCAAALLFAGGRVALAGYTWSGDTAAYVDYNAGMEYARPYIEAMRQAKATCGWLSGSYFQFRPSQLSPSDDGGSGPKATRAWYGMMLAEKITPLDTTTVLVPGTDWYWDNRRWFVPYADQMAKSGLITYGAFSDGPITRQEAFSWVVRICGLGPVAQAMSDSEVSSWLAKAPDGPQVASQYRRDVALAMKLGICKGSEGGFILPTQELFRERGAIIAYRAIAVNVWPDPPLLAPKEGQVTAIRAENVAFGTVTSWTLVIQDPLMQTVREWSGSSLPSTLATWDGKDSAGNFVGPGTYYIRFSMNYRMADTSTTVSLEMPARTIRVDARELRVTVAPLGAARLVEARVIGKPATLRADVSWGASAPLVYDPASGIYTGVLPVPTSLAKGMYQVTVTAVLTDGELPPKAFTYSVDTVAGGLPEEQESTLADSFKRPELPIEIRLKREKEDEEP